MPVTDWKEKILFDYNWMPHKRLHRPRYPNGPTYVWIKVESGCDEKGGPAVVEDQGVSPNQWAVGDAPSKRFTRVIRTTRDCLQDEYLPDVHSLVRQRDGLQHLLVDAEGDSPEVQRVVADLLAL